jgi:hypothetical protein
VLGPEAPSPVRSPWGGCREALVVEASQGRPRPGDLVERRWERPLRLEHYRWEYVDLPAVLLTTPDWDGVRYSAVHRITIFNDEGTFEALCEDWEGGVGQGKTPAGALSDFMDGMLPCMIRGSLTDGCGWLETIGRWRLPEEEDEGFVEDLYVCITFDCEPLETVQEV